MELKPQHSHPVISQWANHLMMWYLCALLVCAYCICVRVALASGSECVDVWESVLWTCIIVCGEVCACLYIYEVLVQTFNLPQPSECAERRLGRCVLSPSSPPPSCLPAFPLLHKSPTLTLSTVFHTPSLNPAPTPLFMHPMLGLILELLPWIPASSWRCLSTPA